VPFLEAVLHSRRNAIPCSDKGRRSGHGWRAYGRLSPALCAGDRGLMGVEAGLHVDYLPLAADTSVWGDDVLGVATFRSSAAAAGRGAIPVANIRMPVIGSNASVCEVWRTPEPLESGQRARIPYRRSEQFLFGCISVPESAGLETATRE